MPRPTDHWRHYHFLTLAGIVLGLCVGALFLALILGAALSAPARAEALPEVPAVQRIALTREAQRIHGPRAPVARFAAQIHAESSWRPSVCSRVGACGLAQVMPGTAEWLAEIYPRELQPAAPADWAWSIRALVIYDRHLHRHAGEWSTESDHWAAVMVAYVGGLGWVNRERRAAAAAGDDPARWWVSVERHCLRGPLACRESRHYPRRILCELEPVYIRAGWPGQALPCRSPT